MVNPTAGPSHAAVLRSAVLSTFWNAACAARITVGSARPVNWT